jgi:hypothetical protein
MFERRYTFLPILVGILRLLGAVPIVVAFLFILAGGLAGIENKPPIALGIAVAMALGPFLVGVVVLAVAELLRIFMDVEENTRRTADGLDSIAASLRPAPTSPGFTDLVIR